MEISWGGGSATLESFTKWMGFLVLITCTVDFASLPKKLTMHFAFLALGWLRKR